jgi:hypothetical protein
VVNIATLYTAQRLEAPLELGEEYSGYGRGRGKATSDGADVKLANEDATVEARVVVWMEEVVEATTGEHEGKE